MRAKTPRRKKRRNILATVKIIKTGAKNFEVVYELPNGSAECKKNCLEIALQVLARSYKILFGNDEASEED